jgi:hypothetical protein
MPYSINLEGALNIRLFHRVRRQAPNLPPPATSPVQTKEAVWLELKKRD